MRLFELLLAAATSLGGVATVSQQNLWPGQTIPFLVDPILEDTPRILPLDNALAQLTHLTCLSFIARTTEPNFIVFSDQPPSIPCWNILSMHGGEQIVNIGANCLEPVNIPATVTRIFSDCDVQKVQYLYPCPGVTPVQQTNCTSIFNLINNVPASIVPCHENCPYPTYANNVLPIGSKCKSACDYSGRLLPLLRAFNGQAGSTDNFYTTDAVQFATLTAQGYLSLDPIGYLGLNGQEDRYCNCLKPLLRLHHPVSNDHFYTTNKTESDNAEKIGYVYQRVEGYCTAEAACGAYMPLFRFFNMLLGDHLYTTNKEEMASLQATPFSYVYEGIECFIWQYEKASRACETL